MRLRCVFFQIALLAVTTATFCESTNIEKYEANKKSFATAIAFQLLWPGAGDCYYEPSLIKPIVYPVLMYGSLLTGIIGASSMIDWDSRKGYWVGGGIGLACVVEGVGILDLAITSRKYQERMLKKYDLVLSSNSLKIVCSF